MGSKTKPSVNGQHKAPEPTKPRLTRPACEVQPRNVTWLWPERIVSGALAIVEARKGHGKSTLITAIAAAVTGGPALPNGSIRRRGPVLWLAGEEDVDTVVAPRLMDAGAKMDLCHFMAVDEHLVPLRLTLPSMLATLREMVLELGLALVVLDPLVSFVDPGMALTVDQEIHGALDPLNGLAHSTGCTILFSRHLTKNRSADPIDRGQGGAAVGGVAKSILVVDRPDRRTARRVCRVVACNLSSGDTPDLEYYHTGAPGRAIIERWRTLGATDEQDDEDCDRAEAGRRADARMMLRALCEKDFVEVSIIQAEAFKAGLGWRTVERAKSDLDIMTRRVGTITPARWEWGPPYGGWPKEGGGGMRGGLASGGLASKPARNPRKPTKPRSKTAKGATE